LKAAPAPGSEELKMLRVRTPIPRPVGDSIPG
jgi:hypothetical protein